MSRAVTRAMAFLPSEAALQSSIVQGLEMRGYTVLQVGRWLRQAHCPNCDHHFTPRNIGHGNTPGTPDLLIAHADWGPMMLAMELKAPGAVTLHGTIQPGRLRKEQKVLAALGVIVVVTSWEQALAAVEGVRA